ncbi:MAG: fimbrillin family protein [Candidatus Cryptobacteroides sp.]
MKKSLFLAALAVVAMASCTKNELKVPSTGTEAEITFQPVVANATKATYLTTDNMNTACTEFAVFAWYAEPAMNESGSTVEYMNNVKVTYNSGKDDSTAGIGAWVPTNTYYWPKNGTLSFDAYAPLSAHSDSPSAGTGTFTSVNAEGLQIANYTVADLDKQYDLLFSERALNKTTSVDDAGSSTYDGVDIAFKHALSAIEVKANTLENYGTGTIKLEAITIINAYNKGKFTQGMTNAVASGTPAWNNHSNEVSYVLYQNSGAVGTGAELSQQPITSSTTPAISNAILLPQEFDHGTNKVSIKVDYSIKNDSGYLKQTKTFDLTSTTGFEDTGTPASLTAWEIGKKYTYTLIFSLEDIYFAPSVTDWKDVTVTPIDVK